MPGGCRPKTGTDSVVGNRNIIELAWLGPIVVVMVGAYIVGCSPKRVVRTEVVAESLPQPEHQGAAETLPPPEYRGAAGTSSLETAKTSPAGMPAEQQLTGSSLGLKAAALAKEQLGKPYQWGASGPEKFDCSGLVMYVYNSLGVKLPRVTGQQAYAGVHVDRDDLQVGDLVFFKLNGSRIDHVGIYVGHSKFVHAPRKHMPVRTDSLNNSYWRRRLKGGRRLN
jgi:cell wall-associated NlpC family hydrolase